MPNKYYIIIIVIVKLPLGVKNQLSVYLLSVFFFFIILWRPLWIEEYSTDYTHCGGGGCDGDVFIDGDDIENEWNFSVTLGFN